MTYPLPISTLNYELCILPFSRVMSKSRKRSKAAVSAPTTSAKLTLIHRDADVGECERHVLDNIPATKPRVKSSVSAPKTAEQLAALLQRDAALLQRDNQVIVFRDYFYERDVWDRHLRTGSAPMTFTVVGDSGPHFSENSRGQVLQSQCVKHTHTHIYNRYV